MLQFASTTKSRISPDLEKGNSTASTLKHRWSVVFHNVAQCHFDAFRSDEEEDDEEEESEDESGDLVLQSSSLSAVDEEKDPMEPPTKQPRTNLNLHALTESHSTPP